MSKFFTSRVGMSEKNKKGIIVGEKKSGGRIVKKKKMRGRNVKSKNVKTFFFKGRNVKDSINVKKKKKGVKMSNFCYLKGRKVMGKKKAEM